MADPPIRDKPGPGASEKLRRKGVVWWVRCVCVCVGVGGGGGWGGCVCVCVGGWV